MARPAPIRTRATAPGSCSSCRTSSSAAVIGERRCRSRAATASRCASCRATRRARGARAAARTESSSEGQKRRRLARRARRPAARRSHRGADRAARSASSSSAASAGADDQDAFERKLYVIRRRSSSSQRAPSSSIPSFSSRTIVYKGMLTAPQLPRVFPRPARRADRERARPRSLALLDEHVPELGARAPLPDDRAQRRDQHRCAATSTGCARASRSSRPSSSATTSTRSCRSSGRAARDSATFDNVLELLVLGGRSLPHAIMMMIPEAYAGRNDLPAALRASTRTTSCLMEAWDGPAAVVVHRRPRDRRDARSQRPAARPLARDGGRLVVLASETGVLDDPAENILRKGRLQPGKLFLVDLEQGRIVATRRSSSTSRRSSPTASGSSERSSASPTCPSGSRAGADRAAAPASDRLRLHPGGHEGDPRAARAQCRGGRQLDGQRHAAGGPLRPPSAHLLVLQAAVRPGHEPADRLDPRGDRDEHPGEHRVRAEPLRRDPGARAAARVRRPDPARRRARAAPAGRIRRSSRPARSTHLARRRRAEGMDAALERLCHDADAALDGRHQHPDPLRSRGRRGACAVPSLLAVAGGPSSPRAEGTRLQAGLVVESGEARSVHSVAAADRLRGRRRQPVPDARDPRRARRVGPLPTG